MTDDTSMVAMDTDTLLPLTQIAYTSASSKNIISYLARIQPVVA